MRMRHKKHLEERLAACGDSLRCLETDDLNFETAVQTKAYIDTTAWFGNDHPIQLEIGCGKGFFAREIAKRHPDINFIAMEKDSNVMVAACEEALKEDIPNLRFIKGAAEYLPRYIRDHSVQRIYLNFSCPYPKNRYAGRRLTADRFLPIYQQLLVDGGDIHQKTDNRRFFEFSLEQFSAYGFLMKNISLDLHHSDFEGNIVTEYEERFASQGMPIYRLEAVPSVKKEK